MSPKTAEVQQPASGTVVQSRISEQFRDWLQAKAASSTGNRRWDVAANQLDHMLTQTDLDAIMDSDEGGTIGARDLEDFIFTLHEFDEETDIAPAPPKLDAKTGEMIEAPLGVFILLRVTALVDVKDRNIKTGDDVIINTGSPLIIGKVRTLQANGFLPMALQIKGSASPGGRVLRLKKPVTMPVQGSTA